MTVLNSRSPRALLFGGYFILAKNFVGEFMRIGIAAVALAVIAFGQPAIAEEAVSKEAVRIETDQSAKAFIFIIDDEPVAMLDKTGLYVPGEIAYGLWLTDTGPEYIEKKIADKATEAADE